MGKPTNLQDMDGTTICIGDIVEFHYHSEMGHSKTPHEAYTRMRDLVEEIEGVVYFTCAFGGSFAYRHVDFCRVIGTDQALIDT